MLRAHSTVRFEEETGDDGMKWLARTGGAATVIALAVGLAACTGSEDDVPEASAPIVQLGAPGEDNRTLSPEEAAELASPPHTAVDVDFVRDMLHHHTQAIQMTGYVPDRAGDEDVKLLAERMELSQTDEIVLLETWLRERGEPVRDPDADHADHAADMPGILTDAQLAQLEAASGDEFDRLFLEFMIFHHQGAIEMVHDLYDAGGGLETEIDRFALHVEADQDIEIKRMEQMLASLNG
ncbi:DUF305 domain-containing protein [Microbacterium awajiense]|uniref:DUF305 domain-containing protein n=1 Tax=Microbacterium awajiense TaxID=415214 RepID=A0ABP7AME5_9MICO